jgi:hypothetical protein
VVLPLFMAMGIKNYKCLLLSFYYPCICDGTLDHIQFWFNIFVLSSVLDGMSALGFNLLGCFQFWLIISVELEHMVCMNFLAV